MIGSITDTTLSGLNASTHYAFDVIAVNAYSSTLFSSASTVNFKNLSTSAAFYKTPEGRNTSDGLYVCVYACVCVCVCVCVCLFLCLCLHGKRAWQVSTEYVIVAMIGICMSQLVLVTWEKLNSVRTFPQG